MNIVNELKRCKREEEVKAAYVKWLDLKVDTSSHQDLITDTALWECKYKKDLNQPIQLARVLAQSCYYLRRAQREGTDSKPLPRVVVVADVNQAVIVGAQELTPVFDLDIDWKSAPSSPDPRLVTSLVPLAGSLVVYGMTSTEEAQGFREALKFAGKEVDPPKRRVTMVNFEDAYTHWVSVIGRGIEETELRGPAFVADLGDSRLQTVFDPKSGTLQLTVNGRVIKTRVSPREYEKFWSIWDRPPNPREFAVMVSHTDRLKAMETRRFQGVFYTPKPACARVPEYLEAELGAGWEDEYYVWDPCCGVGNLTYFMERNISRCFLSTLDQTEVDYIEEYGLAMGAAEVFQYDYVNDDIDKLVRGDDLLGPGWKLPLSLRRVLKECPEKLVILMNPPYAAGTDGIVGTGVKRSGVSSHAAKDAFGDAGRAKQELYTQFLLRSSHHQASVIAVFSKMKLTNTQGFEKVRELLPYGLTRGFVIPSRLFHGVKGEFPVGFQVLRRGLEGFDRDLDVLEEATPGVLVNTGTKYFGGNDRKPLNKLVSTIRGSAVKPPLKSAVSSYTAKVSCDTLTPDALGYMKSQASDVQHSGQFVAWYSSVEGDGHGWSLTPDNLRKSAMIFAVRKVIKQTWLNDRDQFTVPAEDPDDTFYGDCLVYTLFHGSNQTSSLKDVMYKGEKYQIRNQFYPYAPEDMIEGVTDTRWYQQLARAKPTVIREELQRLSAQGSLSEESYRVLAVGEQIYRQFNRNIQLLNQEKYKIEYWDAGWYQVRNALKDAGLAGKELECLMDNHRKLAEKLEPQVYDLGFLRK